MKISRFKNPSASSSHYSEIDQTSVETIFHKIDKGVKKMVLEQKSDILLSSPSSQTKVMAESQPKLPKANEDSTSDVIAHKMSTIPSSNSYPMVLVEPQSKLVNMNLNEDKKGDSK